MSVILYCLIITTSCAYIIMVQEGSTPLYTAADCGHSDVVKLLLAANADPNCVSIVSFILFI